MLEWMIAIVALCGAIAGFAALYLVLRFAMQVASDRDPGARRERVLRRWRRRRDRQCDRDWNQQIARVEELLPRARIHRCGASTGRPRAA